MAIERLAHLPFGRLRHARQQRRRTRSSMKACCRGPGRPSRDSPSTVTTSLPSAAHAGVSQAGMETPSTSTWQAPHSPLPQPKRVPFSPQAWRSTSSSDALPSASTVRSPPFTRSRMPASLYCASLRGAIGVRPIR
jgi:hypothetical protein